MKSTILMLLLLMVVVLGVHVVNLNQRVDRLEAEIELLMNYAD